VWPDGHVGEQVTPHVKGKWHTFYTSAIRALDPERLNPFTNRALIGQKRMEQSEGSLPWGVPPEAEHPTEDPNDDS